MAVVTAPDPGAPLSAWAIAHLTEELWSVKVTDTAELFGWRWAHFRPTRTAKGWRTAQNGHPGYPDLTLARDGVVILAELKKERGRYEPGQREWIAAAGEHGRVWRPSDWPEVYATLSAPRTGRVGTDQVGDGRACSRSGAVR